jgi:hypothetical protein
MNSSIYAGNTIFEDMGVAKTYAILGDITVTGYDQ